MRESDKPAYVAVAPCGCVKAMIVVEKGAECADLIAEWLRSGLTLEQVPEARAAVYARNWGCSACSPASWGEGGRTVKHFGAVWGRIKGVPT